MDADAVVLRARIGNQVTIGEGALVVGPGDDPLDIPKVTVVPAGARIMAQAQIDAL